MTDPVQTRPVLTQGEKEQAEMLLDMMRQQLEAPEITPEQKAMAEKAIKQAESQLEAATAPTEPVATEAATAPTEPVATEAATAPTEPVTTEAAMLSAMSQLGTPQLTDEMPWIVLIVSVLLWITAFVLQLTLWANLALWNTSYQITLTEYKVGWAMFLVLGALSLGYCNSKDSNQLQKVVIGVGAPFLAGLLPIAFIGPPT